MAGCFVSVSSKLGRLRVAIGLQRQMLKISQSRRRCLALSVSVVAQRTALMFILDRRASAVEFVLAKS
jgi:hypothetical protein